MSDEINRDRRALFGTAAMTLAAAQLGFSGLAHAQLPVTPKRALYPTSSRGHTHRLRLSSRSMPAC
jgi:hypothetical protein